MTEFSSKMLEILSEIFFRNTFNENFKKGIIENQSLKIEWKAREGGGLVEGGGISMISTVFKWVAVVKYCLYVYYYLNIVNGLLEEVDDGSIDCRQ